MENCTRRIVHSVIFVRVCLFVCVARPSAGFQSANMDGSQMDVCAWVCCAPISISSKSINQLLHQKPCTCTTSSCTVLPNHFSTRRILHHMPFSREIPFTPNTSCHRIPFSPEEFLHSTTTAPNSFYTRDPLQQILLTKQLYIKNLLSF